MATSKHLEVLSQGARVWDRWRSEHAAERPDLRQANLSGANLRRMDLQEADLGEADLSEASLIGADLHRASLTRANLRQADLSSASLYEADLAEASLVRANLHRTNLSRASLLAADLGGAVLTLADLRRAGLRRANLRQADLSRAVLFAADLRESDLSLATLRGAVLQSAYFGGAKLSETDLRGTDFQKANLLDAGARGAILDPPEVPDDGLIVGGAREVYSRYTPPGPKIEVDSPEEPGRHTVVPVFFATNRRRTGRSEPNRFYGRKRLVGSRPELGLCRVSVPAHRRMGEMSTPKWWKGEFRPNPKKHVIMLDVAVLRERSFYSEVARRVSEADERGAFVFVHGFKTSFSEAIRRTGQLAYDLGFDGAPIAFSWPTAGTTLGYSADESTIEWSIPFVQNFLEQIAERSAARKLHLIAHSMGSRALSRALEQIGLRRDLALPVFSQIILAAPDIDIGTFRQLSGALRPTGDRVTLYASSSDWAIRLSERLHQAPRAGSTAGEVLVVKGVDTIDVSSVDTGLMGHSYYGDKRSVVADMFNLIRNELPPASRPGLRKAAIRGGLEYWVFT